MANLSILNDVLGPVMRGPSSSHTAAALRIGRLVRDLAGGAPRRVTIDYASDGSLATTHQTQGSDMGIVAGMLGWDADDGRLVQSLELAAGEGVEVEFRVLDFDTDHPNTYRVHVVNGSGDKHTMVAISTGGGAIEVVEIDGCRVRIDGQMFEALRFDAKGNDTVLNVVSSSSPVSLEDGMMIALQPVMPVIGRAEVPDRLASLDRLRQSTTLDKVQASDIAIEYESIRGGISQDELSMKFRTLAGVMRRSIDVGLAGTRYDDRLLDYNAGQMLDNARSGKLLPCDLLNKTTAYCTAVLESKSAMEVIVAGPTAGSCGTVPGAIFAAAEVLGVDEATQSRALAAAGITGLYIAREATFAAEVAGCQAECGVAGAMAAAGLAEMMGCSAQTAFDAASLALQNLLGLICDPIANRVEAPCLGRNVTAALGAIGCVNLAISGIPAIVPLEETARTMLQVGRMLPRELRCTALGGLSIAPSAKLAEQQLMAKCRCDRPCS